MSLYSQGLLDVHEKLIVDRGADGERLTASDQVHMCGNSVSPYPAEALVGANCGHLKVRDLPRARRAS